MLGIFWVWMMFWLEYNASVLGRGCTGRHRSRVGLLAGNLEGIEGPKIFTVDRQTISALNAASGDPEAEFGRTSLFRIVAEPKSNRNLPIMTEA